jgi:ribosomal protein S15P/S13E
MNEVQIEKYQASGNKGFGVIGGSCPLRDVMPEGSPEKAVWWQSEGITPDDVMEVFSGIRAGHESEIRLLQKKITELEKALDLWSEKDNESKRRIAKMVGGR